MSGGRDVRQLRISDFIADGLFIDRGGAGYPGYGAVRVFYGDGEPTPLQFEGENAHVDGDLSVGGRIIGLLDCLSNAAPEGASATGSPGSSTNVSRYDHKHPHQALTIDGDATASGTTALTLTLATVNTDVGTFGGAAAVPVVTVNAKGLVTAAATVAITPAAIGAAASSIAVTGGGLLTGGGDLTQSRVITIADVAQNTVLGRIAPGAGAPSSLSVPMIAVATAADTAASRAVLGLGDAALRDAGTGAGNVLLLETAGALPPLSGAALTDVSAVPASAVVATAVNLTLDVSHNGKAVVCTAAVTITLPAAAGLPAGWSARIKPQGGDVAIATTGGDSIDGVSAITQPKIGWGSKAQSVTVMVASSSSFISL